MLTVRSLSALVAAGALASAVLAGCGGDDKNTLDHAELVQQANAACKSADAKIAQIAVPTTQAGLATYATKMAAATGELHDAIAALEPDEATDQNTIDTYATGLAQANAALATMGAAAKAGDVGRVRAQAARIEKLSVGVLAARAGLSACATAAAPAATS